MQKPAKTSLEGKGNVFSIVLVVLNLLPRFLFTICLSNLNFQSLVKSQLSPKLNKLPSVLRIEIK